MYRESLPAPAIRIIVPGEPLGYRSAGKSFNKVSKRVWEYYGRVRKAFNQSGITTPLFCESAYPVNISIRAFYSSGIHCDPGNTNKGAIDALFYKSLGPGDKFVSGSFDVPFYDAVLPRTEIELRGWYLKKKYAHLVTHSWEEVHREIENAGKERNQAIL